MKTQIHLRDVNEKKSKFNHFSFLNRKYERKLIKSQVYNCIHARMQKNDRFSKFACGLFLFSSLNKMKMR